MPRYYFHSLHIPILMPHRSPCVRDTSSIHGNTPSTNQEPVRESKGPLPHGNRLETPQAPPYPPWDPPWQSPGRKTVRKELPGDRPARPTPPCSLSCRHSMCRLVMMNQKDGAMCLPEYSLMVLQLLLMEDTPPWTILYLATCCHDIGCTPSCSTPPRGVPKTPLAYK
jgi:hypothetical protein